jgi:hypothetical protein
MPTSFQTFNPGDLIEDTHVEQFIEPIQNLESGKPWYGDDTGSANAFEVDLDPAPSAYTEGLMVHFLATNNVTGATTLNVNSLGTKALLKEGGDALASGDIVADQMVSAIYDGADFRVLSAVMNPTISPTAPTVNLLVYSDISKENTGAAANMSLPSFTFNPAKSYLMEVRTNAISTSLTARVTLSDGTTSYGFPSSSTSVRARTGHEAVYYKILPNLTGLHTVVVNAGYTGYVSVKIYEIYDQLVYADFTASQISATPSTISLANFTAASGHTYLMVVTGNGYSTAVSGIACYLTQGGTNLGIPQSSPTTELVQGGTGMPFVEATRIMTGLSGAYTVTVRCKSVGGVSVRIYDIT